MFFYASDATSGSRSKSLWRICRVVVAGGSVGIAAGQITEIAAARGGVTSCFPRDRGRRALKIARDRTERGGVREKESLLGGIVPNTWPRMSSISAKVKPAP